MTVLSQDCTYLDITDMDSHTFAKSMGYMTRSQEVMIQNVFKIQFCIETEISPLSEHLGNHYDICKIHGIYDKK
jgi:hypothetical protein